MFGRKVILALVVFMGVAVLAAVMVISKKPVVKIAAIHFHAGFRVYIDNKLQDYSAAQYMNFEPCTTTGEPMKEDDQAEKAHLHDGVGDVVHVHRKGATWNDLFTNIKVSFAPGEELTGYDVSGGVIPDILSQPIKPYASVVIVVGDQTKAKDYVKNAVTLAHIKEVESKSETCGASAQ